MAQIDPETLGKRLKFFRERAHISQFELENRMSAANGMISRIEKGKVNPTKETVMGIAEILKLSPTEIAYVLDINHEPTEEENESAKKHFNYLTSSETSFGYLIDNKSKILAFSEGFKRIAKAEGIDLDKLVGRNIVELTFDTTLGIRGTFSKDKFEDIAIPVLAVLKQEREFMLHDTYWVSMFDRLSQYPDFDRLWDKVQDLEIDLFSEAARTVYFQIHGHPIAMIFRIIISPLDPRFSFVEYIPKHKLMQFLVKLLK